MAKPKRSVNLQQIENGGSIYKGDYVYKVTKIVNSTQPRVEETIEEMEVKNLISRGFTVNITQ